MNILNSLEVTIQSFIHNLDIITEQELNIKLSPTKWSKKEILGHLCDSAINNHLRFLNIIKSSEPIKVESYDQNYWVNIHDYQGNYNKQEIITLWQHLNKQILILLNNTHENQLNKECIVNNNVKTLEWLIEDYINHMKHHINQIIMRT